MKPIEAKRIDLSDKRWHYRGEGNANLVITIPEDGKIIRFAKTKYPDKDQDAKITEIAYFANEVMRPALGSHFVRPLGIGVLGENDFKNVKQEAQKYRPLKRCKKDIQCKKVIWSPDCVFLTKEYATNTKGDTISIEIKPKQGWHSLMATCSVDLCHRCLKQHAKLYQGEIDSISRYCPLDLFSGDKSRMKRAIFDLYEHPHNRFKIFKNGKLLYNESTGDVSDVEAVIGRWLQLEKAQVKEHLMAMLCTTLLAEIAVENDFIVTDEFIQTQIGELKREDSCDTKSMALPKHCILQKVLNLQKHTDISNNEAKNLCEKLLNNIDDLEGLQQLILWYPHIDLEHTLSASDLEDLTQLQKFLLSVTANDISLLLTFCELDNLEADGALPRIHINGKHLRCMVSVIDLDPKPVHRITSWVKRKEEWLKIYFDSIGKKKGQQGNLLMDNEQQAIGKAVS